MALFGFGILCYKQNDGGNNTFCGVVGVLPAAVEAFRADYGARKAFCVAFGPAFVRDIPA